MERPEDPEPTASLLGGGAIPSCPKCGVPMRWQPEGWDCPTIDNHRQCGGRIWLDTYTRAWVAISLRKMTGRVLEALR